MSLLQPAIERKLSTLLGAPVTFGQFKLSWLKGSIEILDITVAGDDPARPLLSVRRLFAEISLARAMKKQIVIKSLAIERPVLSLLRRADGTLNLPRRPERHQAAPSGDAGDASSLPVLEAQKVLLVDGAIAYHDENVAAGAYHAAVEGIQASLQQSGPALSLTLLASAAGRRNPIVELGPLHASATFNGAPHLGQLSQAAVSGEGTLGPSLRLTFQCPRLAEQRFEAAASGPLDLPTLLALLPADLVRQLPQTTGQVEFNAKARYSPSQGLDIPAAEVRLHNLALRW